MGPCDGSDVGLICCAGADTDDTAPTSTSGTAGGSSITSTGAARTDGWDRTEPVSPDAAESVSPSVLNAAARTCGLCCAAKVLLFCPLLAERRDARLPGSELSSHGLLLNEARLLPSPVPPSKFPSTPPCTLILATASSPTTELL